VANEEVLLLPLVEDPGALPHLPAICGTRGVDVVLAGPGDLSLAMGIPGGVTDPRVLVAVEQIRAAAAVAGKPVMTVALDAAHGRALYVEGYQGLIVGVTAMLANTARDFLGQLGRA
jgi:2-keto-3-deoxy-L-rhamnonate aldolase RhmA